MGIPEWVIGLGVLIVLGAIGISSKHFLGDDNQIEEIAEVIIEDRTGHDIDLTPDSKEKNND